MRVNTRYRGRRVAVGDTVDVPDEVAERWAERGLAARASKRNAKAATPKPLDIDEVDYPEGFPGAEHLRSAGITPDKLAGMTEGELVEVDGIGYATAAKIIAAR